MKMTPAFHKQATQITVEQVSDARRTTLCQIMGADLAELAEKLNADPGLRREFVGLVDQPGACDNADQRNRSSREVGPSHSARCQFGIGPLSLAGPG